MIGGRSVWWGQLALVFLFFVDVSASAEELWECSAEGSKKWIITTSPAQSTNIRCRKRESSGATFQRISPLSFSRYERAALAEMSDAFARARELPKTHPRFIWNKRELAPGLLPKGAPRKTYCLLSGELRTEQSHWVKVSFFRDKQIAKQVRFLTHSGGMPLIWSYMLKGSCEGVEAVELVGK